MDNINTECAADLARIEGKKAIPEQYHETLNNLMKQAWFFGWSAGFGVNEELSAKLENARIQNAKRVPVPGTCGACTHGWANHGGADDRSPNVPVCTTYMGMGDICGCEKMPTGVTHGS